MTIAKRSLLIALASMFFSQAGLAAPELLDPPEALPLDEIVPMDFVLTDNALKNVHAKEMIGPGFVLAKALNVLPPKIYILGCQSAAHDEFAIGMSQEVTAAIPKAIEKLKTWLRV